jgi:galactoside O-acetyltransferase
MEHKPTGESIPRSGIKDKMFLYMEHVSGDRNIPRFLWQSLIFILFKGFPSIIGSFLRPVVYKTLLGSAGSACLIERHVRIASPSNLYLGKRVFLGEASHLDPGSKNGKIILEDDVHIGQLSSIRGFGEDVIVRQSVHMGRNTTINGIGGVEINKDVMFGPNVSILSGNHHFRERDVPIRLQGVSKAKVTIEEDVWLATNVTVIPGVTIGKGSVIGAGAVVTKNIPPYSIAAGVPACVIGTR